MQSPRQSLYETLIGIAIGFVLALLLQMLLCWAYNKPFTAAENLEWTLWFTILSVIRSYYVRRFFNWLWRH
jgi:NhaP-type Na+/H+ or K+/H+ antiporter